VLQGMYDDQFEIEQEVSLDFENSFDILEVELIEEEKEWNKKKKNNEREEKSYYVKEIVCVNDDTLTEYKRRAWNLGNLR